MLCISPPLGNFPRGLYTCLHSAPAGCQATVSKPYTVNRDQPWTAGFHVYIVTYAEKKSSINLRVYKKITVIIAGPQICHCEAPTGPWQSREGSCVFADSCPTIQPGTARLPRARSALAMTSLGALHIRRKYLQICSCQRRSLTAATDAIGAYRFHGGLYKSAVPSRDCHVASLLAMTIRGASTVLTIVCQFRRCSAGSGMPLPYNARPEAL